MKKIIFLFSFILFLGIFSIVDAKTVWPVRQKPSSVPAEESKYVEPSKSEDNGWAGWFGAIIIILGGVGYSVSKIGYFINKIKK